MLDSADKRKTLTTILILDPDTRFQKSIEWAFYHDPYLEFVTSATLEEWVKLMAMPNINVVILDWKTVYPQTAVITRFCAENPQVKFIYTLTEEDLTDSLAQYYVSQAEFVLKTASQQEWWMRLNKLSPMPRRNVVVSTPHHDVFEQVQMAVANLPINVDHVPDLNHALAHLQANKAVMTLWDVQEQDAEAIIEAVKLQGPILALASFETLSPVQWMLLRLADDTIQFPFSAAEIEARIKKNLKNTLRQVTSKPDTRHADRLKVTLHHEIRNPLTSILIGSQALAHQFQEGSAEKKVLNSVEQSAKRIQTVMDTLLTHSNLPVEEYIKGVEMLSIP